MIKSFSSKQGNISDFIAKVTDTLSQRELGKIVHVTHEGSDVTIHFSKLGKSEVVFQLQPQDSGFECQHIREKIALTHKALRPDIEGKLAKILESSGASIVQG